MNRGTRPGPVHHRGEEERVEGGHEPGAEAGSDQSCTATSDWLVVVGSAASRAGDVVAQGHHREQADGADEEDGRLEGPGGDEADRGVPAEVPDDRVQRDGGADAGDAETKSSSPPQSTLVSLPCAEDEVEVVDQRLL